MIQPPSWSSAELSEQLEEAIRIFRHERLEEPLEHYLEAFEDYRDDIETLLEKTIDLTLLHDTVLDVLTDQDLLNAFRYLPGPPISIDDLKVVAEASSLTPARLRN